MAYRGGYDTGYGSFDPDGPETDPTWTVDAIEAPSGWVVDDIEDPSGWVVV